MHSWGTRRVVEARFDGWDVGDTEGEVFDAHVYA